MIQNVLKCLENIVAIFGIVSLWLQYLNSKQKFGILRYGIKVIPIFHSIHFIVLIILQYDQFVWEHSRSSEESL